MAVSFFMYLVFWVPHSGRPVPIFKDIASTFSSGTILQQGMILAAVIGIGLFVFLNTRSRV